MDDFYAARSGTIPPLPWPNFAPPLILNLSPPMWGPRSIITSSAATGYSGACGTVVDAALSNGKQMVSVISSSVMAGPVRNRICSRKIA